MTCSGATSQNYFNSQYQGVKPQLDALHKNTQLVTMTIGGNNSNVFIDSIAECSTAGISSGGKGHPCKTKYGNSFDKTIRSEDVPAADQGAASAVHKRAAEGARRDPHLPLDPAEDHGLLPDDADRQG